MIPTERYFNMKFCICTDKCFNKQMFVWTFDIKFAVTLVVYIRNKFK